MLKLLAAFVLLCAPVVGGEGTAPAAATPNPHAGEVAALLSAKTDADREAVLAAVDAAQLGEFRKALVLRAHDLFRAGEHEESLRANRLNLDLARRLGDRSAIVEALGFVGLLLASRGRFDEAQPPLDEAVRLAGEWGLVGRELGWALNHLGWVAFSRGDYVEARERYLRSLAAFERDQDPQAAFVLSGLGKTASRLGRLGEALDYFRRSLEQHEKADSRGRCGPLYGMGEVYQAMGDHSRALESFQKTIEAAAAVNDALYATSSRLNIGSVFRAEGDYEKALEFQKKALQFVEEKNLVPALSNTLTQVAETYELMGETDKALAMYDRALTLARRLGQKFEEASLLHLMAKAALDKGDVSRALEQQRAGLAVAEEIGAQELTADLLLVLASAHFKEGRLEESLSAADRAGTIAQEAGYLQARSESRTAAARVHRARGDNAKARRALDEAIAAVEEIRSGAAGDETRQGRFFEMIVAPYYEAVDLAVASGDLSGGLAYAERAKARILLDALAGGRRDVDKSLSEGEREERHAAQAALRSMNAQINGVLTAGANPGRLAELRRRQKTAREEYESVEMRLESLHPALRTRAGRIPVMSADDLRGLAFPVDTALVELAVLPERVVVFVLSRDSPDGPVRIEAHSAKVTRDDLRRRVRKFRGALAARRLDFVDEARALYDLLLGAADKSLRGRSVVGVVPDDVLWELPFQALMPRPGSYLLDTHAIFSAPSLSVLREMRVRSAARETPRLFLGVGNPAPAGPAVARISALHRDLQFGALPDAEREVRGIRRMYDGARSDLLVGSDAREGLLKERIGNYEIVHLATHGVLDDANPLYSHVVLAPEPATSGEDGVLEAWEILQLELKADMVVLSACQTARGRVRLGEGVIGMSWALLAAGCPTTVVTHWSIDSARSASLMTRFHRELRRLSRPGGRLPSARALQRAGLALRRTAAGAHPFYWAGFSVVGVGF